MKLFGTDGIRGLANHFPMTSEMAVAVGRAVAFISKKSGRRPRIVVGKDTRLANYMIETALTSGICSMGADVYLIGPLPTPGVAFVTQSMRADAGIMISASHNPYHDTGIKIFSSDGYKLPDEVENHIESLVLTKELDQVRPIETQIGKAYRIEDALGRYVVYLKSQFPKDLDLQGLRIILDCANGAGYKAAPLVFEELGAEVIRKNVQPNGQNINDKCGALYPDTIGKLAEEYRADIGISLDGDGDRCILSDEKGNVVDGDQMLGLCALHFQEDGKLPGNKVVATPMSNLGLERALKKSGIELIRVPVGDRYVVETMRKEKIALGGEQSGHIVFLDQSTTGDGIMAGLKIIEIMRRKNAPLSLLTQGVSLMPQVQSSVKVSRKEPFENLAQVKKSIDRATDLLKDRGRVYVRYSGTEPVARVMIEGEDYLEIQNLSKEISLAIQRALQ